MFAHRPRSALVALLACAALATACGDATPPPLPDVTVCPLDAPTSCIQPAADYADAIAPILAQRCTTCHAQGMEENAQPLTTYGEVYGQQMAIATQVAGCTMPPPDTTQLTAAERATVLAWLACNAPDD